MGADVLYVPGKCLRLLSQPQFVQYAVCSMGSFKGTSALAYCYYFSGYGILDEDEDMRLLNAVLPLTEGAGCMSHYIHVLPTFIERLQSTGAPEDDHAFEVIEFIHVSMPSRM